MSTWLDNIMSPLNAAGEGLQKLIETRDLVKFGDTFRKLHGDVLAAMQGAIAASTREAALLDRVSQLEKEMARFETWEDEKKRYELKEFGKGAFAYSLKVETQGTEPMHQICPNCHENRRKSILQIVPGNNVRTNLGIRPSYRCQICKTEVVL